METLSSKLKRFSLVLSILYLSIHEPFVLEVVLMARQRREFSSIPYSILQYRATFLKQKAILQLKT
jgi:hypothetical protein